jgi:hypothetical protein
MAAAEHSLDTRFQLYPLHGDEELTCRSMLKGNEGARLTVMPTHNMSAEGNFAGFRYQSPVHALGSALPISRTMFHGHTLVECQASEETILRFMSNPRQNNEAMLAFLRGVHAGNDRPATLDCVPENASSVSAAHGLMVAQGLRSVDSQPWTEEVPERIGIYHAYVRGCNRDVRTHKMYLVCSGGLQKASDSFCNLLIDVGQHWTAKDVCESEEAWWLRKACYRARCRLLHRLAEHFQLSVNAVNDVQAYNPTLQAASSTDTVEHDLVKMGEGVAVYSGCVDTTRNMNGILCAMHPSEGMWLFRGSSRGNSYGSMFGSHCTAGVFPTSAPRVRRTESVPVQDGPHVVRLSSPAPSRDRYMCFDEAYFKTLEAMQWNRDNGHVELIPIVVGLQ